MQTWNVTKLSFASHCKSIQKSKHWNFKSRNVHKFATCLFEHAAKQDHGTQLNQWLYAENQASMQTDTHSFNEC
jgi:hypothetical protein